VSKEPSEIIDNVGRENKKVDKKLVGKVVEKAVIKDVTKAVRKASYDDIHF
jgi:hypothetical protein